MGGLVGTFIRVYLCTYVLMYVCTVIRIYLGMYLHTYLFTDGHHAAILAISYSKQALNNGT